MKEPRDMKEPCQAFDFSLVLASSVHDMKNSLGMLLNSLEQVIADTPPQNSEQASRFATLQYESSRINGELIQLLSLYRMQNNMMPVHVDEQYLIDTVDEQLARNHMLFTTRNIDVVVDIDDDLVWYYDGELIGGVIHNVLINCARYTKKQLLVRATIDEEGLTVGIADDGQGYPPAMLDNPYNPEQGVSFSSGSTNLGLFFANQVVALHENNGRRGYITLKNNGPLGGGLFELHLP